VWRAKSWAYGGENIPGSKTGYWRNALTFVEGEGVIALFGEGADCCYVEAFDVTNGKAKYRFASNNWNITAESRKK
jgi:hypothetical protein